MRVDLGDTSGTSRYLRQAEELSITTAPWAATFSASAFEVAPPAEQHDVQTRVVGRGGVLDGDGGALEIDRGTHGPGGGEQPQLVDREVALGQDAEHDCADLTGGADDSDLHEDSSVLYTCASVRSVCRTMMRMSRPALSNPLSDLRTLPARTAESAMPVPAWENVCGGLRGL
ncbi:hypothetical protein SBADM41S_04796 [Streptomyces badius]